MKAILLFAVIIIKSIYSQFDQPSFEDIEAINAIGQIMGKW